MEWAQNLFFLSLSQVNRITYYFKQGKIVSVPLHYKIQDNFNHKSIIIAFNSLLNSGK